MHINAMAVHTHPRYWGSDSLEWQPKRWIKTSFSGLETFSEPLKGSYLPWSEGPRVCPGRKFAQVEFVAVITSLFRHHRVRPAPLDGENSASTTARVLRTINDSGVSITLQMRKPESVSLIWSRRE